MGRCGSVSPLTEEEEKKYAGLPSMDVTEAVRSFQVLEDYFGKKFYGIIATELGGENTADTFHVAALMGKPIIDADGVPVTNPFYEKGQRLVIFALPAPVEWTTARGLEVFGPESFGFEMKYTPFGERDK